MAKHNSGTMPDAVRKLLNSAEGASIMEYLADICMDGMDLFHEDIRTQDYLLGQHSVYVHLRDELDTEEEQDIALTEQGDADDE